MARLALATATSPKADIHLTLFWRKGRERMNFRQASTYWSFGKRFSGKSSLIELIGSKYLEEGATLFDIFSARDGESLAWLRSPYTDVMLVCGDAMKLECPWPWVKMKDFRLEEAERHQLVITCPQFYANEYEQYATLSRLVDILKWRIVWDKVDVLMVREAGRLVASRIISGKVSNRLEAEYDFIDLHNEAYHTGLCALIDSVRPIAVAPDVREIANYVFVKKMGRMKIPAELWYVMKHIDPQYLRRMPIGQFVMVTDNDNVAVGYSDKVPWHISRGENLMKNLGITVQRDSAYVAPSRQSAGAIPETGRKITQAIHANIMEMRRNGKSYREIRDSLQAQGGPALNPVTIGEEIKDHEYARCGCMERSSVLRSSMGGSLAEDRTASVIRDIVSEMRAEGLEIGS